MLEQYRLRVLWALGSLVLVAAWTTGARGTAEAAGGRLTHVRPQAPVPVHVAAPMGVIPLSEGRLRRVAAATAQRRVGGARTAPHSGNFDMNLTWHNGPVLRDHIVYTVYWVPTGYSLPAGYASAVDHYFATVATGLATGAKDNVYGVAQQYCGTSGGGSTCDPGNPAPSFGGSVLLTLDYPTPGADCAPSSQPACVTKGQVASEIDAVASTQGWTAGQSTLVVLLTPPGVDICTSSGCSSASGGADFCAFHSHFTRSDGSGEQAFFIAPYVAASICPVPHSPQGGIADTVLDVASHEHVETITDPFGSGWFHTAAHGGEIADLCTRNYGPPRGRTQYDDFTQLIGGSGFWLQQQWSNADGGCVQGGLHRLTPQFSYNGKPVAGAPIAEALVGGGDTYAPVASYSWRLGDGATSTDPRPVHTYSAPGSYQVVLTITDAQGSVGTAGETLHIGPAPPAPPPPSAAVAPGAPPLGELSWAEVPPDVRRAISKAMGRRFRGASGFRYRCRRESSTRVGCQAWWRRRGRDYHGWLELFLRYDQQRKQVVRDYSARFESVSHRCQATRHRRRCRRRAEPSS